MSPDTAADLYVSAIHLGDVDALAEGVSLKESAPPSFDIFFKSKRRNKHPSLTATGTV